MERLNIYPRGEGVRADQPEVIEAQILRRLDKHVQDLCVSRLCQGLVLRGRVRTYYARQLVDQAVTEYGGDFLIVNDIDVV